MKKTIIAILFTLVLAGLLPAPAIAGVNTHSIWTNDHGRELWDAENGCSYGDFKKFNMATSWTEPTPGYAAQAHFRGVTYAYGLTHFCNNHYYEFSLNRSTATTNTDITGYWDVYRDGTLMCGACDGIAYGLNGATGSYYKLLIDDPIYGPGTWYYSGFIDQRKDF
jgi:hypothetical protein